MDNKQGIIYLLIAIILFLIGKKGVEIPCECVPCENPLKEKKSVKSSGDRELHERTFDKNLVL